MDSSVDKSLLPELRRSSQEVIWANQKEQDLLSFENAPFPMYILDENTLGFLAVNDAAIKEYGYAREDFLSLTLSQIRADETVETLFAEADHVRKSATGGWYSQ